MVFNKPKFPHETSLNKIKYLQLTILRNLTKLAGDIPSNKLHNIVVVKQQRVKNNIVKARNHHRY